MKKASVVQHIIPSWFRNIGYADLKLTYNEVYLQIVFLQSLSYQIRKSASGQNF